MKIGVLVIGEEQSVSKIPSTVFDAVRLLELKGHDVVSVLLIAVGGDIKAAIEYAKAGADAMIVMGNVDLFQKQLSETYALSDGLRYFEIENMIYLLDTDMSADFILKTAIPALNTKCKTYYTSVVLKTFGATLTELKDKLSDCMRNKNRIAFRLLDLGYGECEVRICFSKKTNDVNEMIARAAGLISDYIFSLKGESLEQAVVARLRQGGKTLCTAESFTGGGVSSALVSVAGASAVFKEGIVSYSNRAKRKRLDVAKRVLEECGAVSIETAYEMAANALLSGGYDYSIATTGNAGPSAEKDGQAGLFFVAVGSKKGIHVYKEECKGDRETVIRSGIKTALFRLYRKLCEDLEQKNEEQNDKGEENQNGERQENG